MKSKEIQFTDMAYVCSFNNKEEAQELIKKMRESKEHEFVRMQTVTHKHGREYINHYRIYVY
jgi:hypothetical protein